MQRHRPGLRRSRRRLDVVLRAPRADDRRLLLGRRQVDRDGFTGPTVASVNGTVYLITATGDLRKYAYNGTRWDGGGTVVGTGWLAWHANRRNPLTADTKGRLYAVDATGHPRHVRHDRAEVGRHRRDPTGLRLGRLTRGRGRRRRALPDRAGRRPHPLPLRRRRPAVLLARRTDRHRLAVVRPGLLAGWRRPVRRAQRQPLLVPVRRGHRDLGQQRILQARRHRLGRPPRRVRDHQHLLDPGRTDGPGGDPLAADPGHALELSGTGTGFSYAYRDAQGRAVEARDNGAALIRTVLGDKRSRATCRRRPRRTRPARKNCSASTAPARCGWPRAPARSARGGRSARACAGPS